MAISRQILSAQIVGILILIFVAIILLECHRQWTFKANCEHPESDSQALFNYVTYYYCSQMFPNAIKAVGMVFWLLTVISLLASTADNFFVPALEKLSEDLGLSEEVAGVTLLALGNGMPDLMTATSSINGANDFGLVMGDIFGAASFILTMVLGAVLLCSPSNTKVEPATFLLNCTGYVVAVSTIFAISWDSSISLMESLGFFVFYSLYVVAVVQLGRFLRARGKVSVVHSTASAAHLTVSHVSSVTSCTVGPVGLETGLHNALAAPACNHADTVENEKLMVVMNTDSLTGLNTHDVEGFLGWLQYILEWPFSALRHLSIPAVFWSSQRRVLAAVSPAYVVLVCALGFGGSWGSVVAPLGSIPVYVWSYLAGAAGTLLVVLGSSSDKLPKWHTLLLALSLLSTIAWFNILANECVAILETFGLIFNISSATLGMTVLAWGNCVGDLVADTALARTGKTKMAVAGIFGSMIFSDCLGLGVALTAYTATSGSLLASLTVNNKLAAIFLLCSLFTTAAFVIINRFSCPRWFATVLIVEYAVFMVASVCVEINHS